MKSDNEVPRAEDQKKAEELLSNVETFCHSADQGDSYIYESLVERIASALATQRQGFERERRELQARIYSLAEGKTNRIYIYEGSDLEAKELNRLESANSALEERVKELEGAFRSANYSAQTFENECTRLKAKVAELTAELQATRKACDQAHQNTLDREEERDRLKAENVELRKTEDAVLGWTHPNFKWYADKIDSLTSRLSCALEALKKILRVCRLRKKWMNPTLAESELKKCTEEIEAESVLTSPDNLRMVEREPWYHADGTFEMLPVEKVKAMRIKAAAVIKAAREFCKVRVCCHWNPDTADEEKKNCMHPLSDALEALEAHEKGGGV